ncbi:hypothetical protein ACIGW8_31090 [Streptomyces sioyaensis]|uniref:hypothetical protein n=1 Tax=Streptomyces sioyaensis TaxID=67364 RepID=UPI0037D34AEA
MTVELLAPAAQCEASRFMRDETMHALFQDAAPRFPATASTSDTNGAPKGVIFTHENVVRLFDQDAFAELCPAPEDPSCAY